MGKQVEMAGADRGSAQTLVSDNEYDVIVVGAGHAGIEAALAAARIGADTLILTQNLDTVGQMSCNPAIGGLAKGQLVREIDALGGAIGINADVTGLQFRMLNRSKGPCVRAPRVQCDKKAYQLRAKWILERQTNLDIKQGGVVSILVKDDRVLGIETDLGNLIKARSVIITAGTFLAGMLHVGRRSRPGGRMSDTTSPLSDNLRSLGFETRRFKTGTPCRIHGRTIDFSKCQRQDGDEPRPRFSFLPWDELNFQGFQFHVEQMPCWLTTTKDATHEIIHRNLQSSALYSGNITGVGPRYCPSIEDKVVKFPDRITHQVFLEPEGRQTEEYYANGISTSLPLAVQEEFVRSIPGLESAEIMRPGYAVEYDWFPPTQLLPTLETKRIGNLYFAGQINGTSGYEEAAAQGLIAGANAALRLAGRPELTLSRTQAYIGVLIDDLVTKGTNEPYRMFTSRAEHRLLLRAENADIRLTRLASSVGLADRHRHDLVTQKIALLEEARSFAGKAKLGSHSLLHVMRQPGFNASDIPSELRRRFPSEVWEQITTDAKYEGYIARQGEEVRLAEARKLQRIPEELNYLTIPGLRNEARQKLASIRPATFDQASSISGVTPSDLGILAIWIRRKKSRA